MLQTKDARKEQEKHTAHFPNSAHSVLLLLIQQIFWAATLVRAPPPADKQLAGHLIRLLFTDPSRYRSKEATCNRCTASNSYPGSSRDAMKDHRLLLSFDVSASRYGPGSAVPARACNLEQYSDGTVDQLSPTSGPVRNSSSLPPSDCTTATQHRRTVNTRANLPPLYTPYGRSRVSSSPSVAPHRLATLVPGQPGPSSLRDQLDPRYIKMQFYIPPHRGAIWQEYLDRQAVERRNRLEMAKHIMTWYSDLESEVAQHFQKALEGSAAKRRRLVADSSCSEPPSPLLSADNCDVAGTFALFGDFLCPLLRIL